jgi:hypothetical protein
VIQRGGVGERPLTPGEAVDVLMSNCEDAYGFPPYSEIEGFLQNRNGADLKVIERAIVEHAVSGAPTTLVMSDSMDWWRRLPAVADGWRAPVAGNGRPSAAARVARGAPTRA